ncbi:MAG TPA: PQQ-binding-like beta-propeller repeat protein, partial [Bacteroidia bacterium]|nr:PQQ-binding-like beta-propeller repeat protein [Bacteroidia bacterium]
MTLRLLLVLAVLPAILVADDWPEFRGPTADGHAPGAKPPTHWSATENIRWKVPVPGKAWSSPVVADGKVYVTTAAIEDGQLSLRALAFQLADGAPLWDREVFRKGEGAIHQKNSHASPTPVHADGRLYVHFGHDGTAALNAADGSILWTQTSLPYPPVHGNGGSPALHGDKLIFSCDGASDPFVVALDIADGSVAWKTPRNVKVKSTFSFSTPLIVEIGGKAQAIVPGSGAVVSYDPADGREIWRFGYGEGFSVVPRPLFRHGIVYVCSGFARASLFAVRADGTGDVTDTHLVWKDDKTVPKESSPILVGDWIFFNDDKGILSCLDAATGEERYRERLDGRGGYSASPVYAGGHLYFHNGDGMTTVVKPGDTFQKVAENQLGEYGLSSF